MLNLEHDGLWGTKNRHFTLNIQSHAKINILRNPHNVANKKIKFDIQLANQTTIYRHKSHRNHNHQILAI